MTALPSVTPASRAGSSTAAIGAWAWWCLAAALAGAITAGQVADGVGELAGYAVAIAGALWAGWIAGRHAPVAPVVALLCVGALLGTPVVDPTGDNAAVLAAVGACVVAVAVSGLDLRVPERPVLWSLAAYVVAATVATALSIDRSTSLLNLAGTGAVLLACVICTPTLLAGAWRHLLSTLVALGTATGLSSIVLWIVGNPVGHLGAYYYLELTWRGDETGLVFPRASAQYLRPGLAGLTLALGIVAALVRHAQAGHRGRRVLTASIVVMLGALLLTMSRSAEVGLLVGVVLLVVVHRARHLSSITWVVGAVTLGALVATMSLVGANSRLDISVDRYGRDAVAEILNEPSAIEASTGQAARGGTEVSSRVALWRASARAVADRPVFGFGPGTDADAIAPRLAPAYAGYAGLSSHNTPLRIAVEVGLAGVLALACVHLAAVRVGMRSGALDPGDPRVGVVAAAAAALSAGLFETLNFGGFVLASMAWTIGIAALGTAGTSWSLRGGGER